MDLVEKDGRKAVELPWKFELKREVYTQEWNKFIKIIQMDKYRYGTPKDKKIREGKIPFTITKISTNVTEEIMKQMMEKDENQAFKRLYEIQEEVKEQERLYKEEKMLEFICLEMKYYTKIRKLTGLDLQQTHQGSSKISQSTKLYHQRSGRYKLGGRGNGLPNPDFGIARV
jgi:hypothetical protein